MDNINLVESFSEFKEFKKNIDREMMMRILEDVFRSMLIKKNTAQTIILMSLLILTKAI